MTPEILESIQDHVTHVLLFGDTPVRVLPNDRDGNGTLHGDTAEPVVDLALKALGFWPDETETTGRLVQRTYGRIIKGDVQWIRIRWTTDDGLHLGSFRPREDIEPLWLVRANSVYIEHGVPTQTA